jgi:hypothetical protein
MTNGKDEPANLDSTIHEWSRHYDQVQWTITAILAAVLAAAAAKAFDDRSRVSCAVGIVVANVLLFYAASFREMRFLLHRRLSVRQRDFFSFPGRRAMSTWKVLCLTVAAVEVALAWRLYQLTGHWFALVILAGVLLAAYGLYLLGKDTPGSSTAPPPAPEAPAA